MTTEPAVAPAAPASPAPAAPAAPSAPASWFSTFDAETQGHIQNRGWDKMTSDQAAAEAVKAHRNAERMLGVPADRVLKLPEKFEGADMAPIYDRLGRPAKAEDYEIMTATGETDDFAKWAKNTFHELGLSKSQAKALSEKWNEHVNGEVEGINVQSKQTYDADVAALQGPEGWGQAYEQNRAIATGAREALGVSDEEVDAMGAVLGIKRTLELFHSIGTKTMEDVFQSSGNGGGTQRINSPQQAIAKIAERRNDDGFRKKLIAGDVDAKREWEALQKQAYGG